jgi:hypothetical protein
MAGGGNACYFTPPATVNEAILRAFGFSDKAGEIRHRDAGVQTPSSCRSPRGGL